MKSTEIIKASANSLNIYSFTAEALERLIETVKAEQSCPTCEALARTVMLDQTSHDAQRKPLTDEQVWDAYMEISAEFDCNVIDLVEFARAIEAKLKEKNNV
jgi:hypothetical protein